MAAKLVVALALCASLARCAEVAVGVDGSAEPPFASVGIKFDKSQEQTQVEVAIGEDAVHAALRFVYHVRAINPDVDFACRIADIVEQQLDAGEATTARTAALAAANNTVLKTAGKHVRRAEESALEDRHMAAAADYLRASRRKGIERDKVESFRKMAEEAMRDEKAHREQLEKEAAARAIYDARMAREAASRDAALARRRDAEAGFRAMLEREAAALAAARDDPQTPGPGVAFTLNPGDVKCKVIKRAGEDGAAAAARFCAGAPPAETYECTNAHALDVARQLGGAAAGDPAALRDAAAVAEAAGDLAGALADLIRAALAAEPLAGASDDGALLVKKLHEDLDRLRKTCRAAVHAVRDLSRALDERATDEDSKADWTEAVASLGLLVRGGAPTKWAVWLARSRAVLGDHAGAEAAAAAALQHLETSDKATMRLPFDAGAPKTLALTIGAAAALERGRLDKSIKFVQAGLRHDPDSAPLKKQYDGLKSLKRKTEAVDKHLRKGYSVKALDALDEAFGSLDALSHELEGSRLASYRATLQLRACHANSKVKRHEVAFDACDGAVAALDSVDARAARALAYERDDDFESAVRDWRACIELVGGERMANEAYAYVDDEGVEHDLRRKLQDARRGEDAWEKRRDHAKVLELPANVDSLSKDRKCFWLKKHHKKMARQWHPDKARGSKERAARKMAEVSDAKQALSQQYGC